MLKHKLVDFIIQFMEEVDKEISEMKLFVCSSVFWKMGGYTDIFAVERKSKIRGGKFFVTGESPSESATSL